MKKRILSLVFAIVLVFTTITPTFATQEMPVVEWAGAMNFNSSNNYVTANGSVTVPNFTEMKWAYPLNATQISGGAYYAGQSVIADGWLYATGGGKLHKINTATGEGSIINESAGSIVSYYDYLCYADEILILSTQTSLEAYGLNGAKLGSVSGTYGYYHPVQYKEGYVICNGFIYKLEKSGDLITFTQVGTSAIGEDTFNWSNGAFVNDFFYVASKTTIYAVDYKTSTVVDSFTFDEDSNASNNIQGGVCYDEASKRLFWGTYTYDKCIYSIEVDNSESETKGRFVNDSFMMGDAGQNTVATPVVYNGRVYIAGQQGKMCVISATDLTKMYDVTIGGGKVQGNPILSTADGKTNIYVQCTDGHLYMFTDKGENGTSVKVAETENPTKVLYPNAGFEQYAMDKKGNIYCYNESGYLFCFGRSECEIPTMVTDLPEKQIKLEKGKIPEALRVEATVNDGGTLSYKWQKSEEDSVWTDIKGANEQSYIPHTDTEGTTCYRCIVTNTNNENTACVKSKTAEVIVKTFSNDTTLNVLVNGGNSATSSNPQIVLHGADGVLYLTGRSQRVTNLWLGTVSDATVSSFEFLQGIGASVTVPKFTKKTTSNVYNGVNYNGYYRSTSYTLPIVAKAEVTAEDGVTKKDYYIVIEEEETLGNYVISADGFIADKEEFYNETGVVFTQAGQEVTLTPNASGLGTGEVASVWSWSSSDLSVAKVDENGKVTCIGGGSTTITATCGRVIASCNVSSSAELHSIHSYENGVCSVCGTSAPTAVNAKFTLTDQEGNVALSKDGTTKIYKVQISVVDADSDGTVTLNDAFITLHKEHSANGEQDFVSSGGWMTKLWGVNTYNSGYMVDNVAATSLLNSLSSGDDIYAFFYRDTTNYSDLYTYFSKESKRVSSGTEAVFEVNGASPMGGVNAKPKNAKVSVLKNGAEINELETSVDAEGKFRITFPEEGTYIVQVSGTCSYTGTVWGADGPLENEFQAAPVILSQIQVEVMPYCEATVYVTVSDKTGEFSVDKNGNEMYRIPVKTVDSTENPDGKVSILEVIKEAHAQYHPQGAEAFSESSSFITHLWGVNTAGNIGYFFNDVYLSGSGTKTGTNGREFEDKLLNTIVADGDCFNIYALQDTRNWTDTYTYFSPVTESATAGESKTITVKSADYSGTKIPSGAKVKIKNSGGEIAETSVEEDGTFSVTFPEAGIYTADVRSDGTAYFVPSRLTVTVSAAQSGELPDTTSYVFISVKDPQGRTYLDKTRYEISGNETAYSLLLKTGLNVEVSTDNDFSSVYIESIEGLGEFDGGSQSGWMYKVNGSFPDSSSDRYILSDGDYVEWVYTRNLGEDVGNSYRPSKEETKTEEPPEDEEKTEEITGTNSFADVEKGAWYETAVAFAAENKLFAGVSETEFAPNGTMTRAMLVTVLHRLEGTDNKGKINFADVKDGEWYKDAVSWAAENKIVSGVSENEFAPDDNITREQIAVILYRYAILKNYDTKKAAELSGYADFNEVSSWSKDALEWATAMGIIKGTSETTLSPKETATRAEVATMFMRFAENIAKE